tara:strand:- start:952 stop:1167 length:216 start_codon:yes stop_codon:yes gene_type:complete
MDDLKELIEEESEQILKVINLKHLTTLNNEEQVMYLRDILYDFWESQEDRIKKAIDLGEAKAKKLIDVTEG